MKLDTALVVLMHTTVSSAQQFVMYSPVADDTAVERVDPIIYPGQISQHVHQVFGANKLSPSLDYASLQQSSCTTVGSAMVEGNAQ